MEKVKYLPVNYNITKHCWKKEVSQNNCFTTVVVKTAYVALTALAALVETLLNVLCIAGNAPLFIINKACALFCKRSVLPTPLAPLPKDNLPITPPSAQSIDLNSLSARPNAALVAPRAVNIPPPPQGVNHAPASITPKSSPSSEKTPQQKLFNEIQSRCKASENIIKGIAAEVHLVLAQRSLGVPLIAQVRTVQQNVVVKKHFVEELEAVVVSSSAPVAGPGVIPCPPKSLELDALLAPSIAKEPVPAPASKPPAILPKVNLAQEAVNAIGKLKPVSQRTLARSVDNSLNLVVAGSGSASHSTDLLGALQERRRELNGLHDSNASDASFSEDPFEEFPDSPKLVALSVTAEEQLLKAQQQNSVQTGTADIAARAQAQTFSKELFKQELQSRALGKQPLAKVTNAKPKPKPNLIDQIRASMGTLPKAQLTARNASVHGSDVVPRSDSWL